MINTAEPDLSESITPRLTLLFRMFQPSTLFFKPLLVGVVPSMIVWACAIEIAMSSWI